MKHELSNKQIADALGSLLWPNMAVGNKTIIQAAINALLAAHEQEPVVNSEAVETLQKICNIFRIGIQAQTQSTILANVENAVRFADQLHAIEREFFMVPGEPDEDYPDDEPADVCLVNCWGSTTELYVEQFRSALMRVAHPAPSTPAAMPEEMTADCAWGKHGVSAEDCSAWADGWNARAAMLQSEQVGQWVVRSDQRLMETPVAVPSFHHEPGCDLFKSQVLGDVFIPRSCDCRAASAIPAAVPDGLRLALSNAGIAAPESDEVLFATHEKYVQLLVDWVRERKPFSAPNGYVLVPVEPTEGMLLASYREASVYSARAYRAMIAAAPKGV